MATYLSRRSFIRDAAQRASALLCYAWGFLRKARAGSLAPNERISLGFIGVGGMGTQHLRVFLRNPAVYVRAVCDVSQERRQEAAARVNDAYAGQDCQAYNDFRAVLDRDDIDGVVISTPDHWHVPISIMACQAGKDVYCEKPLTRTISEGKALVCTVKRYGRVFQTGTQQRSSQEFRFACALARGGRLGRIHTVRLHLPLGAVGEWPPDSEPPPGLDWDLWLGPAPWVPFNPARHPGGFRFFWDYSGGSLTDWGSHHIDTAQWGLGMDGTGPIHIQGKGTPPPDGIFETFLRYELVYTYANGVKMVTVHPEHGLRFIGTEGWVHVWRGGIRADPEKLLRETVDMDGEQVSLDPARQQDWSVWASPAHHADWLDCMRTRRQPVCNAEIGHRSVTICHLGNIVMRLGRELRWDPQREQFIDDEGANMLLSRPYRAPWSL